MTAPVLVTAFADPVLNAQTSFRAALKTMSEPGTIARADFADALDVMHPATFSLALTLFDDDTKVWLSPSVDTPMIRANLAFHCACPVTDDPQQADLAIMVASEVDDLARFRTGSDRDPEQSCTVIVQLDSLEGGRQVVLEGPGIESQRAISPSLCERFWSARNQVTDFPRGLDFFMTSQHQLMALPRSTVVSFA
ncbi:phosphonate C-P lyase system protein PhnH [Advenella sp. S44]|uniref:phosphonate C-P lyase system protein PhnH n=1 Tax=Advenella sp. S44 TaxID=1982755 RepID=UPI000C2A7F3F|nr:phosphonate C-P lyase system protein PhnH [Advenella sp. S44]PJX25441.1 phosphonate C-P lyase system protein PhnH [Advenella sp. S44]